MKKLYWLCLALVIYASLYPFNFTIPDLGDIDVAEIFSANSLGDITVNILVFGLIGILTRLASKGDQRQTWILIALAAALSSLAQVLQVFVPGRYPGLLDIVMNLVGLALGFRFALWIDAFVRRHFHLNVEIAGPTAFLSALFLIGQLYPFFPALRLSGFKQNYWSMLTVAEDADWALVAEHAVYWYVFMVFVSTLGVKGKLRILVLFSPLVFFGARLAIIDNVANVWQLVGGFIGVCLFVLVERVSKTGIAGIIAVVSLIAFEGLTPFTLRWSVVDFTDVIWKTYVYGSLIYLLWMANCGKRMSIIGVVIFLLAIEILQTFFSSGAPELANPALALLTGLVLYRLPTLVIHTVESHKAPDAQR